jgi:hypothetical protein
MNYKRSEEDHVWLIPMADMMTALAVFFMVMFLLTIMAIKVTSEEERVQQRSGLVQVYDSLYVVKASWSGDSANDVDLYLKDPNKNIIYFKNHDIDEITLERDVIGKESVYTSSGDSIRYDRNDEIISIRTLLPGDYIANVHLYKRHDLNTDTPVTVRLYKAVGIAYRLLHEGIVTLGYQGEEKTVFGFHLDPDGSVSKYNQTQVKFIH